MSYRKEVVKQLAGKGKKTKGDTFGPKYTSLGDGKMLKAVSKEIRNAAGYEPSTSKADIPKVAHSKTADTTETGQSRTAKPNAAQRRAKRASMGITDLRKATKAQVKKAKRLGYL